MLPCRPISLTHITILTMLNVKLVNVQLVSDEMNGMSEYKILIAITISTVDSHAPNSRHLELCTHTHRYEYYTLYTFVTHEVCAVI